MRKIFHFDSPAEPYIADATVVCCFDDRFQLVFRKFLRRLHIGRADAICVAGGAKSLASPNTEAERDFVIEQLRTSIRLHNSSRVILLMHSDCGAYGGLAQFKDDRRAEADHHWGELERAAACVRANIPQLVVDCYFADAEGIWAADASEFLAA